jgi:hypothetical protein
MERKKMRPSRFSFRSVGQNNFMKFHQLMLLVAWVSYLIACLNMGKFVIPWFSLGMTWMYFVIWSEKFLSNEE